MQIAIPEIMMEGMSLRKLQYQVLLKHFSPNFSTSGEVETGNRVCLLHHTSLYYTPCCIFSGSHKRIPLHFQVLCSYPLKFFVLPHHLTLCPLPSDPQIWYECLRHSNKFWTAAESWHHAEKEKSHLLICSHRVAPVCGRCSCETEDKEELCQHLHHCIKGDDCTSVSTTSMAI